MPADSAGLVEMYQKFRSQALTNTKQQNDNEQAWTGIATNAYGNVTDQASLDAANKDLRAQGLPADYPYIADFGAYGTPAAFKAHVQTLGLIGQSIDDAAKQATVNKTNAETADKQRVSAVQDYQTLPKGQDGVPSVMDYAALTKKYPGVSWPSQPTKQWGDQFVGSQVDVKDQPEYLIKQQTAKAMQAFTQDPQSGRATINTGNPDADKLCQSQFDSAMRLGDVDLAKATLKSATEYGAQRAAKLDPAVQQSEIDKAVRTETALTPLRIQAEVQKQLQLAKSSPDAFAGIFDPKQRAAAQMEYEKDSKDYAAKLSDAQRIQDFVKAAQSGNQNAPGLIPITELRQMVNRVNATELQMVGSGAGSLYQRVQGQLGSWEEGQPISPQLLKDTSQMAGVMAQAARRTYEYNVQIKRMAECSR